MVSGTVNINVTVTNKLTCKLYMELIFWFEYLDVERTVGGKVLDRPGSQDGLVVLTVSTRTSFLTSFLNICTQNRKKIHLNQHHLINDLSSCPHMHDSS